MADERPRRRRRHRRRGRAGGSSAEVAEGGASPEHTQSALPDWRWLTFPVFVAFAAGIVLMGLVAAGKVLGPAVFFAGVFGLAYGAAHIITRTLIARRRR